LPPLLQESLQPGEWLAVGLAGAGTVGLGATTEEAPQNAAVSIVRAVVVVGLFVLSLGESTPHCRHFPVRERRRRKMPPSALCAQW